MKKIRSLEQGKALEMKMTTLNCKNLVQRSIKARRTQLYENHALRNIIILIALIYSNIKMSRENQNNSLMTSSSFDPYQEKKVIDIPDLVNLIADFCDDQSLSKLSRV